LRLCEQWTAGPKSVFQFDVQGQVATSTHAGLPWLLWLLWLRMMFAAKSPIYFWPFDGFEVPKGKSVVAEVYASLFRRRYPKEGRSPDEHDAFCVSAWLTEMDRRGTLDYYFKPVVSQRYSNKNNWLPESSRIWSVMDWASS
jgi:hypothetical protein